MFLRSCSRLCSCVCVEVVVGSGPLAAGPDVMAPQTTSPNPPRFQCQVGPSRANR